MTTATPDTAKQLAEWLYTLLHRGGTCSQDAAKIMELFDIAPAGTITAQSAALQACENERQALEKEVIQLRAERFEKASAE